MGEVQGWRQKWSREELISLHGGSQEREKGGRGILMNAFMCCAKPCMDVNIQIKAGNNK